MKRFISMLLILTLIVTTGVVTALPVAADGADGNGNGYNFQDVPVTYWAYDAIQWGTEKGLVKGTSETTFDPEQPLTRAMFATFLTRLSTLLGYNTVSNTNIRNSPFSDVRWGSNSAWFFSEVGWVNQIGIMTGTGEDANGKACFSPNCDITRQEMTVALARYLSDFIKAQWGTPEKTAFRDFYDADEWAQNKIFEMEGIGLIKGMTPDTFSPRSGATRAQAVTLMNRVYTMLTLPEQLTIDETVTPTLSLSLQQRFRLAFSDSFTFDSGYWSAQGDVQIKNGIATLNKAAISTEGKLNLTCGAISFSAAYDPKGETPFAGFSANGTQSAANLFEHITSPDNKVHDYTILWLDNNVYVYFLDGKEMARTGSLTEMRQEEDRSAFLSFSGDLSITSFRAFSYVTPYSRYGSVYVQGANLYGENKEIAQMMGFDPWFFKPGEEESMHYMHYETYRWVRDDWGVSVIRPMMDLSSLDGKAGYIDRPDLREAYIDAYCQVAQETQRLGMYMMVDWHLVSWMTLISDPFAVFDEAQEFFRTLTLRLKDYDNVLYEIGNEPSTSYWSVKDGKTPTDYDETKTLKYYSEVMTELIHENVPNAVVILGSPDGANSIHLCARDPLDPEKYPNVMYVAHTYPKAGMFDSVKLQHVTNAALARLPVFCTEYGTGGVSPEDNNNGYDVFDPNGDGAHTMYAWLQLFDKYGIPYSLFFSPGDTASGCMSGSNTLLYGWEEKDLEQGGIFIRKWYRIKNGYDPDTLGVTK